MSPRDPTDEGGRAPGDGPGDGRPGSAGHPAALDGGEIADQPVADRPVVDGPADHASADGPTAERTGADEPDVDPEPDVDLEPDVGPGDGADLLAPDGTDLVDDEPVVGTSRPTIDPRIRERRVAIARSQGRRRLRWIGGAVVALVLVIGVLGLMHTPWFGAQAVSVTGTHPRTPSAAIVAAAGLEGHPPLISLNAGSVAKKVESLPFIATAHVRKHWPDGVEIAVTEREPVVQMAGPGASWSLLDGHGRTLEVVPARAPGLVVYIVHTPTAGIPPAPVGKTLPDAADPGLAVSRTLPPAFVDQVVSVTVAADGSISMTLTSGINVLFGTDSDRTAKYLDIASILAHGTLHATSVIDVTVPESPTVSG